MHRPPTVHDHGLGPFAAAFAVVSGLCVATFAASPGLGAPPLVDLQLESAPGCPSQEAIVAAVRRLVPSAAPVQLGAHARMLPEGDHFNLHVELLQGTREIRGETCIAVAEALVVILALAIDPSANLNVGAFPELEPPAEPNSTNATQTKDGTAQPTPPSWPRNGIESWPSSQSWVDAPARPMGQREYPRFGLTALFLFESGALPKASPGGTFLARYGTGHSWGELSMSALTPRWAALDQTRGGYLYWFATQVAGCWSPNHSLSLSGCLGAEVGNLIGRGDGVAARSTAVAPWLATAATLVVRTELRRDMSLEARLGLAVPLLRPEFGLEGYGPFFQPDLISLRAAGGFSWR